MGYIVITDLEESKVTVLGDKESHYKDMGFPYFKVDGTKKTQEEIDLDEKYGE